MAESDDAPNADSGATTDQASEAAPSAAKAPEKAAPPASTSFAAKARALLPMSPELLLVLAVSVAFGLSYGLSYGVDNQTAYMLGSLRLLDKTVLNNDWYAAHTANYHPAFAYVGWFLLLFSRAGWAVGVALVGVASIGAMSVYWLATKLLPRRAALATFLLTLGAMFMTTTHEVATSYAFDHILQPSTLGSLFLLLSLPWFVEGKYLPSGILLGLAGLFHANFLVLGCAVFGLAHLLIGKEDLIKRGLRHLGPSVVVGLLLLPLILRSTVSGDPVRAQKILFEIRSPHHYQPKGFVGDFFPFAAWQMMGLGAGAWLLRQGDKGKRLGALIVGLLVVIWTGTIFSTVFIIPRVIQLFVWRFAPFVDILMQLLVAATVVRAFTEPNDPPDVSRGELAAALGGGAALTVIGELKSPQGAGVWFGEILAYGAIGAALVAIALRRKDKKLFGERGAVAAQWVAIIAALGVCLGFGLPRVQSWKSRSTLTSGLPGAETELYTWLKGNTPKDAIFIAPPNLERFRVGAERAIIADWKGSTYVPGELIEWYTRLEDLSGRPNFRSFGDLTSGYDGMDLPRLELLRDKYKASFAVVERSRAKNFPAYKVLFTNVRYAVLSLEK
jgi:hypothetical protein